MAKENLVLIHSFPTNSILLHGLTSYLDDYFNVYMIDLPGFKNEVLPVNPVSLDNFSKFLDEKIKMLNLSHYVVAGISFGFIVVNKAKLSKSCRGIVAIEPYINSKYLKISNKRKATFTTLLTFARFMGIYNIIWHSRILKRYYQKLAHYKLKRAKIILREMDPTTFFETAKILLQNKREPALHQLPHVLIINKNDKTVDYQKTTNYFYNRVERLLKIETKIGHYPRTVTKNYFKRKLPESDIKRIYAFLSGYEKL